MLKKIINPTTKPYILLGLGIGLLIITILGFVEDQQKYDSPFDQIDNEQPEVGALPILQLNEENDSVDPEGIEYQAPSIQINEFGSLDEIQALSVEEIDKEFGPENYLQGTDTAPQSETETAKPTPKYQLTPIPDQMYPPTFISIPEIDVKAPIVQAEVKTIEYKLQEFQQWVAPNEFSVGWHGSSALLNQVGNTVLTGHHNAFGEVFRDLHTLENGDLIYLYSGDSIFVYVVGFTTILNERFESVEKRIENASWILPSDDERITLISCWPYESNTHRVVVVAVPIEVELVPQGVE